MVRVSTLDKIHTIGSCLFIVPSRTKVFSIWRILSALLFLSLLIGLLVNGSAFLEVIKLSDRTVGIIAIFMMVTALAVTLYQTIMMNFVSAKGFNGIFRELHQIERSLDSCAGSRDPKGDRRHKVRFIVEVVIFNLYFVAHFSVALARFTRMLPEYTINHCIQLCFRYRILVSILVIRAITLTIGDQLSAIVRILKSIDRWHYDGCMELGVYVLNGTVTKRKIATKIMRKLFWIYAKLINVIGMWNSIFGGFYMLLYVYFSLDVLSNLNLIIVYSVNEKTLKGQRIGSEVENIALSFVYPFIIFYCMFHACQEATSKAQKIVQICYRLIAKLKSKDDAMVDGLTDFSEQAKHNLAVFSAAGVFTVNNEIVLPTITMIISYLVVLIQFNT